MDDEKEGWKDRGKTGMGKGGNRIKYIRRQVEEERRRGGER